MPTMFLTRLALIFILAETPPSPGPTLAREDTMHTSVPEVLVRAPRVTLDEILDRVARGETRREAALQDQQFTATFRLTTQARPDSQPILVSERVMRVYKRKPNLVRTEVLREYDRDKRTRSNVEVRFRGGMDEEIVNFAFRPASRREFRYRILGRDLVGGHLIYRIAFEPRSPLDPTAPSGTVWVDTNDFVILRQEIQYTRSPAPLFVRGVKRMVIERKRYGQHWVLNRVLFRIETTFPIPRLGRYFDMAMLFDDYAINTGLSADFFETERKP